MTEYMNSILLGITSFPVMAILFTVPMLFVTFIKYRTISFVRIGLNYAMLLYLLCVTALVLFPLPSLEQAQSLCEYKMQAIPFHFIVDIIKESNLDITRPATYLPEIFNRAFWQIIFNIFMTIPFGMFLRFYFGLSSKKVITYSFLFSLLIEVTQLTGIYGIYKGSYRLCDVDDLMANTCGGYFGYYFITKVEKYIHNVKAYDIKIRVKTLTSKTVH